LSWLNWITVVIAVSCFDDSVLARLLPIHAGPIEPLALPYRLALAALTIVVATLSIRPAINLVSSRQLMNASFEPLHLVNTYGAFGSITRERYEIVLEGTDEANVTDSTRWREYEFSGKPGDPMRRPPLVAPYHMRLDWLMWFEAMAPSPHSDWFFGLLEKLLQGNRD